ncbi:hypothetical protein [Rufibacter roseus]|uniref:Macroglobulin domain-containing protein n=1 Tax=Rufibacter roseus TaxID=1567108 RepID=A0ABW2DNM3_9BACT|nr:hypothetical protein [Rufibacter roseus]
MNAFYIKLQKRFGKSSLILAFLFVPMIAWGQTEPGQFVQNQFQAYQPKVLQEKLFVHTDKEFYLAGETIWFKIYSLEGSTHKPLEVSKVVYLELVDRQQKPILQAKVLMEEAMGKGSLQIPESVTSDTYQLRAYTHWMKNFEPEFFFQKKVSIVNTLVQENVPAVTQKKAVQVQFFPEGGSLVRDLQNTVAFKAVGADGKGIAFSGAIINQHKDTVARFQPLKFGIGKFTFKPLPNTSYNAVIRPYSGKPIVIELPEIEEAGYSMQLSKAGEGVLQIAVHTTVVSGAIPQSVYLFAHTRQQTKMAVRGEVKNGKVVFTVNENKLGEGITHFTVFNEARHPVCERLYFKKPVEGTLQLLQELPKTQFATREKVNIALVAQNHLNKPEQANLSLAVLLADSMQLHGLNQADMLSYVWLASDLKGEIESAGYYLKNTGPEVDTALDNLMLTHGWRRFNWRNVLQNQTLAFRYLPETEGPSVTVQLTHKKSNIPASGIVTFLTLPDTTFQFAGGVSGKDGAVRFDLNPFYGQVEAVVRSISKGDTVYNALIQNPFSEEFSSSSLPNLVFSTGWKEPLLQYSLHTQVQQHFRSQYEVPMASAINSGKVFFGKPDKQYILADYTKFPTLEDVFREYVPEVIVRRREKNAHLYMMDHRRQTYFLNEPLVLFDGVPMFENNKLVTYNPDQVKKLDLITKRYYLGSFAFDGIMNITTYKGNLSEYQLDPTVFIFDYEGLNRQREFYSPVYETLSQKQSALPDFRHLLHWEPDLTTNTDGHGQASFYTSDLQGTYIIVTQGVTRNGTVGVSTTTFEVVNPAQ